jgi:hypothetical protein
MFATIISLMALGSIVHCMIAFISKLLLISGERIAEKRKVIILINQPIVDAIKPRIIHTRSVFPAILHQFHSVTAIESLKFSRVNASLSIADTI